jgi:hypothetical protein
MTKGLDYCLECCEKHLQTASVLMREALQRLEECNTKTNCEPCCLKTEYILEKIRNTVKELAGAEDDTIRNTYDETVRQINNEIRMIRKTTWEKKLSVGRGTKQDLIEIKNKIDELIDKVYEKVAPQYDETIEQIIKETIIKQETNTATKTDINKKEKPKKTQTKKLIKELSKQTKEETEEALRKMLIEQYARVYG